MTRYTNVGKKRTYLQASFNPNNDPVASNAASTSSPHSPDAARTRSVGGPAESSRKRRRKNKEISAEKVAAQPGPATVNVDESKKDPQVTKSERKKKALYKLKAKEKAKRIKTTADRAASSEARRLKRTAGRHARTTCFACRQVGHSAKDCSTILQRSEDAPDRDGDGEGEPKTGTGAAVKVVVGICYGCGSRKHNLARCRQPANPDDPLPFASCFVCSGRGHLASSCSQNNGKGVYPNGGSCKLCGETTHLARDCTLRKIDGSAIATLLGTGCEAGADEDDFHTIRRKNAEVDRDERGEGRTRKEAKVRAGALTGVVKAFGKAPAKPKKVVYF